MAGAVALLLLALVSTARAEATSPAGCRCLAAGTSPVCGSDGTTYPSRCHLDCESAARLREGLQPLVLDHAGPCRASHHSTREAHTLFVSNPKAQDCVTSCRRSDRDCAEQCSGWDKKGCDRKCREDSLRCHCECVRGISRHFIGRAIFMVNFLPKAVDLEDWTPCRSRAVSARAACRFECRTANIDTVCDNHCTYVEMKTMCQCSGAASRLAGLGLLLAALGLLLAV